MLGVPGPLPNIEGNTDVPVVNVAACGMGGVPVGEGLVNGPLLKAGNVPNALGVSVEAALGMVNGFPNILDGGGMVDEAPAPGGGPNELGDDVGGIGGVMPLGATLGAPMPKEESSGGVFGREVEPSSCFTTGGVEGK